MKAMQRKKINEEWADKHRHVLRKNAVVDNKGTIDGLWKGEVNCIGPKAKDADLWIATWEELNKLRSKGILIEVEHVNAHHTELKVYHRGQ